MNHFESSWHAADGLQLFVQGWEPEAGLRAAICLVHGLGEHSGRYAHLADFLTGSGYALLTFDLRGHGKSQGQRGHIPSFEAFMQDIDLLLAEADRRYPGIPRFLYGHSLGGLLVLNYVLRRKPQLAGVIATSAGLRSALEEQKLKVAFAKIASSIAPTLSLSSGLDARDLSRDPEVIRRYTNDPLVHFRATLSFAKNVLPAVTWARGHADEFHLPLLIMHGTADRLTFPEGSQEFASQVRRDCTLKLWEGLYHETHNEPEQGEVFAFIREWLDRRCET